MSINRISALLAYINRADVDQGRPADVADFTAADLNLRVSPNHLGGRVLLADIDNNTPCEPFAVLTLDEAATAKELCLERNLTDEDCIKVEGQTFVVIHLG